MKRYITMAALLAVTVFAAPVTAGNERLGPTPPKPANATNAVAVTCSNSIVQDCGFENGPNGGVWTDASTNFGSPICDVGSCGIGNASQGPYDGTYWAWFGGIIGTEESSESQSITLPANSTATLTFHFMAPGCSGDSNDFIEVTIDGNPLWTYNATGALCGIASPYAQISVDISAFADGSAHTLAFHSIVNGTGTVVTNFFVDDVDVITAPLAPVASYTAVPSLGSWGLAGLLALLGLAAAWRLRRQSGIG